MMILWRLAAMMTFAAGFLYGVAQPEQQDRYGGRTPLSGYRVLAIAEDRPGFREILLDESRWTPVRFGTNLLSVFSPDTRSAWYRVRIRFPEKLPPRELSVYLGEIYDVDETYFNGVLIGSRGSMTNPVRHAYEWDRVYPVPTPLIRPGRDNVLAIRVRGPFDGKLGVMESAPYLTTTEAHYRRYFIGGSRDLLFIIVYLVISAYFLLFFVRRPKEKGNLYFGLYTLCLSVYSFLRTEFRYLLSGDFQFMKKIEYMVLYVTAALFPAYIYSFHGKKSPLPVKVFYILMAGAFLTVAVTDSAQFWSVFNLYVQYVFMTAFLFPFWLMFGQLRKNTDTKYILISFFLMLIAAVNDILVSRDILKTPLLLSYMFFAVVVCLAIILANRFVRVSEALEDLNVNLEKKVDDRTRELNAANRELRDKQETIREEMKVAERVQVTLVPRGVHIPRVPELQIAAFYKPMEDIGGDMYDIVKIEARRYGFLVADVSGHGVPSALITTMLKAVYSYNAKPDRSVAEIARCVNAEMVKLIADIEQYYTAFFAMLDLERRTLTYTNAGHHPALFKRAGTPDITALTSEGIIGGKYTEAIFSQGEMEFLPGDSLLIFTDGIVEAQNPEGRFYGVKTLENFLRGQSRLGADEFVRALETDLDRFCEGVPAGDDRTALYVKGV